MGFRGAEWLKEWLPPSKLTRRVVLGEELAADFEQRTRKGGITAQEWIEQVLRPQVLE